jgi:hypothetical protein
MLRLVVALFILIGLALVPARAVLFSAGSTQVGPMGGFLLFGGDSSSCVLFGGDSSTCVGN